ncbi:heat shock protein 70 family [Gloeopeniophorella convolvens]|nr:heat shock protein 70 family [Gloeopeniophorella convolvens]
MHLSPSTFCVSFWRTSVIRLLRSRITSSWVSFNDEERLRLIARKMNGADLKLDIKHWPSEVVDKSGKPAVRVEYRDSPREFTPEEISAMVLTKMKQTAEAYLGKNVTHAVVAVPAFKLTSCANLSDAQRQATKDAGTVAGLQILRIINEPTAAAIAYGLDKKSKSETQIIVYNLGGGTFDVFLFSIDDGVFEVLATASDTHLEGFDNRIIEYFVKLYKEAGADLKREVGKAKRTLSSQQSTRLEMESFENGNDFSETLTHAEFEGLNLDLYCKMMKPVEQVLKDAGVKKEDVDEVVLFGGSTRIPKVRQLLKGFFCGKEPSKDINPDEAVAHSAAIQGGILSGEEGTEDIVLAAHTLVIEITGGVFTKLIPHNTVTPTRKSQIFSATADKQPTVLIQVYEVRALWHPPAQRGVPQIEVTFEVDTSGIMKISAADRGIGKSESITITNEKVRLLKDGIDRIIREAEGFAPEDEAVRKHIRELNALSSFVYSLKAQIGDQEGLGGQIDDDDRKMLLALTKETAKRIDSLGQIAATEELEEKLTVVNLIMSKLYESGAGAGAGGYGPGEDDEQEPFHNHDEL